MIAAVNGWFRQVIPISLPLVVLMVVVPWGILEVLRQLAGGIDLRGNGAPNPQDAWITLVVISYALHRAMTFHPANREEYYDWLKSTPWTNKIPLLLGPTHLVLQDVVVVTLLWLLTYGGAAQELFPLFFLVPYALGVAYTLLWAGARQISYAIVFCTGFVVLVAPDVLAMNLAAALTIPLTQVGIALSLRRFPWSDFEFIRGRRAQERAVSRDKNSQQTSTQLGWPFDQLFYRKYEVSIAAKDCVPLALLAGWALFLAAYWDQRLQNSLAWAIYSWLCLPCIFVRLWTYTWGYLPPLSLFGRLATGRWIIRRYDRVLVTPLLALGCAVAVPLVFRGTNLSTLYYLPVAGGLVLFISLYGGPILRNWRLAGGHRMKPMLRNGSMFEEV